MPHKGYKQTEEHIRNKIKLNMGKKRSDEQKKRMSEGHRKEPNKVILNYTNKTATLILTKNKTTIIDLVDYDKIKSCRWIANKNKKNWYAFSRSGRKFIKLHRLVMSAKPNEHIDHIDGDGLNNKRSNLRVATTQQNIWNQKKREINKNGGLCSSEYKGVYKGNGKWKSQIAKNGKEYYLGIFDSDELAALAYDLKAYELFGKFAKVNFPERLDTWFG